MIRLIAEGWLGMTGALRLLTFRPGGEACFDVSISGFWRSFGGLLFALPMVVLIYFEREHIGIDIDAAIQFSVFFASWISFPIAAGFAVMIVGAQDRYIPWVILHNWGVVWLYGVITAILSLQVIGVIDADLRDALFYLYGYLRFLVHWRIAYATLGLPTITSAFTAAVPVLVSNIVLVAIARTLAAAPDAS